MLEPVLHFPLHWPPVPPQQQPVSMPTASEAARAAHTSADSSPASLLQQQRDLALWYSSLVALAPSESARPPVSLKTPLQLATPVCEASTSHAALPAPGRYAAVDQAIAFEACMRKGTAVELEEALQLLDVSKADLAEAAALHALQVRAHGITTFHSTHYCTASCFFRGDARLATSILVAIDRSIDTLLHRRASAALCLGLAQLWRCSGWRCPGPRVPGFHRNVCIDVSVITP